MVSILSPRIAVRTAFTSALLSFDHLHHAIAAQDVDSFGSPDRLPATRTNELAGAGRFCDAGRKCPAVCGLVPARYPYAVVFVAVHHDIGDFIFKNPVNQQFTGGAVITVYQLIDILTRWDFA